MILYLTSQQHTNLLDFLTEQTDALPIKKMTGNFMLKQFVIYDMRNFSHCTELVLDRDAFGDDDIHFAEAIEEFLTMYNARITVICEGLQESAPLCHDLLEAGVGNIVTAEEIGAIQNEIRQSLSGQGMTRCKPKERTKPQEKEKLYQFATEGVRITMVSSQSRIGTTTMAFEVGCSFIMSIIICCACGQMIDGIIFFGVFIPLRSYLGGFHMNSYWACFICSSTVLVGILLLVRFCNPNPIVSWIMLIFSVVIIVWKAKKASEVDEEGQHYYPRICIIVVGILFVSIIFFAISKFSLLFLIACTNVLVVISKFLEKRQEE